MDFLEPKIKVATKKACNSMNTPPKPKHIKTIIAKSYTNDMPMFYQELNKTMLSNNILHQYKSFVTLHRVLRDGSPSLIGGYLDSFYPVIYKAYVKLQQQNNTEPLLQITKHYAQYIQMRVVFHQQHRFFTGALNIPEYETLPEEYYTDLKCLSTLSYIMDLMDYLLVVPLPIIHNYSSDRTKLDCTIPLILDANELYNVIIFFMHNLAHIEENESVFTFLYNRLLRIYQALVNLFGEARNNLYISNNMTVPTLKPLPTFNVTQQQKDEYRLKHPNCITKEKDRIAPKYTKEMNDDGETKELCKVGNQFVRILTQFIQVCSLPTADKESPDFKLMAMLKCLIDELQQPENYPALKTHIWKTFIGTHFLMQKENAIHVVEIKQNILVMELVQCIDNIENELIRVCKTHDGIDEFNKSVDEFISFIDKQLKEVSNKRTKNDQIFNALDLELGGLSVDNFDWDGLSIAVPKTDKVPIVCKVETKSKTVNPKFKELLDASRKLAAETQNLAICAKNMDSSEDTFPSF
ncbi:hypothetical protein EIN_425140 [Entamoeba invadens IP1]|uniref:ENTH domain-containing protein n=1 Tax=Entamoeba invadens IP1 TaxID=370355 RepID=A0A0A1U5Z3_ENTIV|nr:hypothetical protein EIN_425140 [Entamoeba invadens IP1]ELP89792.1 hypothetical protein EIN_425140 [Entamoeba invadens IP1]|eukprot:XP_004256563.1 hypothetical protein EIN_425140 [Entamoeba invadens IP1]